jgi:hypothetical protein
MPRAAPPLLSEHAALLARAADDAGEGRAVEIELRWGAFAGEGDGERFESGVSPAAFAAIVAALEVPFDGTNVFAGVGARLGAPPAGVLARAQTLDEARADSRVRDTYDAAGAWCGAQRKEPLLSVRASAQTRLAAAYEVREPHAAACDVAQRRRKERVTLALWGGALRIDATRVVTYAAAGGAPVTTYEVECEHVCERAAPHRNVFRALDVMFDDVRERIDALIARADGDADGASEPGNRDALLLAVPFLEAESDAVVAEHVRARIAALCAAAAPSAALFRAARSRRFAAPMPVALRRADLEALDARRYMVGDKSDGVRLLLYAQRTPDSATQAHVVDRTLAVYRILGADALGAARLPELLLDGELVHTLGGAPAARSFLVFDMFNDSDATGDAAAQEASRLFFYERLQRFARGVVAPLRAWRGAPLPFALLGKQFWPLAQLDKLLAHITFDAEKGGGTYTDARRHHAIDGLVLVPNERGVRPFACTRTAEHAGLFKLKLAGLHSADLSVRHAPLRLCCATSGGEADFVAASAFSQDDAAALSKMRAGAVVECAYVGGGAWRLVGVRAKREPNQLATALDAMLAAAEHITIGDLRRRIAI